MFKEKTVIPKYHQLKEWLKEYIVSQNLKQDDPLFSEPALQKKTGLSLGTIRRSINELVQEGVLYRYQGSGTFIKSTAVLKKEALTNRQVGLVFPEIRSVEGRESVVIMVEELSTCGFDAVLYLVNDENSKGDIYNRIITERPAAVLTTAVVDRIDVEFLKKVTDHNIPVVLINRKADNIPFNFVGTDEEKAGYLATDYLVKKGFKKIGIIVNEPHSNITVSRFKGYRRALKENSVEFNKRFVWDMKIVPFQDSAQATFNGTMKFLKKSSLPDAFFAVTLPGIQGLNRAMEEEGIALDRFGLTTAFSDVDRLPEIKNLLGVVRIPNRSIYKEASFMINDIILNMRRPKQKIIDPVFQEVSFSDDAHSGRKRDFAFARTHI
jgi:GntR family transcriptional regulator, arabinose operon transcriptional repressor